MWLNPGAPIETGLHVLVPAWTELPNEFEAAIANLGDRVCT
jgi:hypothetical protein